MKKILHSLVALFTVLSLFTQAFAQVTPSFDIYGYPERFGPKTEAYFGSAGFRSDNKLMPHSAIYGSDPMKFSTSIVDDWLSRRYPSSSASGSLVIDWETQVFHDLRNYPVTDSRFKYAEAQFIGLIKHIKSRRPNVKVAVYGIPFRVWSETQKITYNPSGKYDNILSLTDYLTPSFYIVYADEEVGHTRNLQYLKDNLNIALALGSKLNKPVIPFVWQKVHDYNKNYGREIIQKATFVKYIQQIANYSYNGKKARGVIWWDDFDDSKRLGDLSGIDNHLVGKLVGSTNAERFDNLMVDYCKALISALQSGTTEAAPAPAPAPSTSTQQVTSFTLFDASSKKDIITIANGATLNLATLPTKNLNIRANTNPGTVGSVKFALTGTQSKSATESSAPYDMEGDNGGWTPVAGSYTLKATPYTESKGAGTAGTALSIGFNVVDQTSSSTGQQVTSFTLFDASSKQDIMTIANGATLNLATLPTKNLNIRANTNPGTVGSVRFALTGTQSKSATESSAPYDMEGDNGGWTPVAGSYTLKATPYTASKGTGTAGTALTIGFKVVDQTSSTTGQQVVSFTLFDAYTRKDIMTIANGATVNLATLPTKNLNIRANTNPGTVGSVKFALTGTESKTIIENGAPYDLHGSSSWTPTLGSYTLKATPYTASKGTGTAGTSLTIGFTVISKLSTTSSSALSMAGDSAKEETLGLKLVAYPNPASNLVNVELSEAGEGAVKINLYSMTGSALITLQENTTGVLNTVIDLAGIQPGLYILEVVSPKGRVTQRIVKE